MGWRRNRRDGFALFAESVAIRLRRTAYLLCGDWHLAEDLAQTALEKLYVAWPKVEATENPEAYATRVVVNAYLDRRRRRSSDEVTGIDDAALDRAEAPDRGDPELRLTLLGALHRLPPRDRAVLVLRYWEDQSIECTAAQLSMTVPAVKAASARALARLRDELGDTVRETSPTVRRLHG
ncbi:sigma-70 family RNA polymerase sigma factor [Yinghuangia sp. YIM S09857]|uniref:sigma-70 family RNA polymerase sigma factor n=1 Tax=Yinghuangia sp. YIM S09857 TaxID=3436929 RepID=UPI003F53860B